MKYAKPAEVKCGCKLRTDGGFTCIGEGEIVEVKEGKGYDGAVELYFNCAEGKHYLDGQYSAETDEYIGLTLV